MIIKILIILIIVFVIVLSYILPKQLSRLSNRLGKSIGRGIDKKIEDLPKSSRRLGEGIGAKIKFADDLLKSAGEADGALEKLEGFSEDILKSTHQPGGPLAKLEEFAGRRVLEKCLAGTPAIEKTKEAKEVEEIGRRLADCAERSYIPFRFFLVDSPGIPNAYAIPGGSILITRTLLDICSSKDELAGILAHEVAHIDCRHYLKRLGAYFTARKIPRVKSLLLRQSANLVEKLIASGYSQKNEFDADRKGALLAGRAGFDPQGLRNALEIMNDVCPSGKFSFFDTHPPTPERVSELRKRFG